MNSGREVLYGGIPRRPHGANRHHKSLNLTAHNSLDSRNTEVKDFTGKVLCRVSAKPCTLDCLSRPCQACPTPFSNQFRNRFLRTSHKRRLAVKRATQRRASCCDDVKESARLSHKPSRSRLANQSLSQND